MAATLLSIYFKANSTDLQATLNQQMSYIQVHHITRLPNTIITTFWGNKAKNGTISKIPKGITCASRLTIVKVVQTLLFDGVLQFSRAV